MYLSRWTSKDTSLYLVFLYKHLNIFNGNIYYCIVVSSAEFELRPLEHCCTDSLCLYNELLSHPTPWPNPQYAMQFCFLIIFNNKTISRRTKYTMGQKVILVEYKAFLFQQVNFFICPKYILSKKCFATNNINATILLTLYKSKEVNMFFQLFISFFVKFLNPFPTTSLKYARVQIEFHNFQGNVNVAVQ